MSTIALEPCPFCGTDDHETSPWPSGDVWVCRCGNPDCAVEVTAETPEAAVAKWNRRAHLAQPAQAVDVGAIREVIEQMRKASMQRAMPPHYQGGCYTAWIDALTSALTGQKAPPVRLRYGLASLSGEILAALRSHGNHDSLIADIQAVLSEPLPGLDALQRWFPSKPPHPAQWEMSPASTGEWVLFSDVANMLARNGYAVADVALNMLVAAGFVSQEKAQEAVSIARGTALRDASETCQMPKKLTAENGAKAAQAVDVMAIREVIESHVEEAKKLKHDPESQDYLHEQADKLTRALSGEKAGPVRDGCLCAFMERVRPAVKDAYTRARLSVVATKNGNYPEHYIPAFEQDEKFWADILDEIDATLAGKPNIDALVDRFLRWPLPKDFAPDCGISFRHEPDALGYAPTWPIGTNLFYAEQAKAMLEHVLSLPTSPAPDKEGL